MRGGKAYSAFDGVDVEDVPLKTPDQQGHSYPNGSRHQRVRTVFDENEDDDGLLDWHHINRLRNYRIFGLNVAPVVDFVTMRAPAGMPESVARKRRAICLSSAAAAVVGIIFIAVLASHIGSTNTKPHSQQQHTAQSAQHTVDHHHVDDQPKVDWSQFQPGELCSWASLYLPDTVVPDVYHLRLEVPMEAPFQVSGHSDVILNVTNATNCIVLHAVNIQFNSVAIKDGDTTIGGRVYGEPNTDLQQVALQFAADLEPSQGRYVLHLHFEYQLQDGIDGLYLSKYTDASGAEKTMVVSQFESVAARKAFPCFDEPRFKAQFVVELQTPPAPVWALSNMPEAKAPEPGDEIGTVLHQFQATPYMSPYLLGIVVGVLEPTTEGCLLSSGANIPVSAWGTPDRKPQLEVAPKAACKALQYMEELAGMAFPLPKLDLVAVPEFAAGAMENWGLIMYNEVDILVDSQVDDLQQRFDVAATIAHEVSHQWFGDLVTCSSWSELWLNEGFATYLENAVATAIVPQYRYFDFFYEAITSKALNDDAMASSHPLTVLQPLTSVGAVDNLFDTVMYEKGAAVLRMLRAYLGRSALPELENATSDSFMAGLRVYLQQKQYTTATYRDLWGAIDTAAGGDIPTWMTTWTLRQNYPVVNVKVSPKGTVQTGQKPFTTAQPSEGGVHLAGNCSETEALGTWWIPFSYRYQSGSVTWQPFQACHTNLRKALPRGQYILANPGRYGLYRVNYQSHYWGLLARAAARTPSTDPAYIADVDFAGLLDDSFRLSEAGEAPIFYFLDMVAALPHRLQPDVYSSWAVAKAGLDKIVLLLRNNYAGSVGGADCIDELLPWLHNITGPYITKMQLPGEDPGITFSVVNGDAESIQTRRLRPLLLSAAAQYGDTSLVHDAATLLAAAVNGNGVSDILPDVRSAVYRAALANGSAEVYDALLQLYRQTTGAKDKRRLLFALATAPTPDLIDRTLALAVSPDVRLSDMPSLLKALGSEGGEAFARTWDFLLANTTQILDRYPEKGAGVEAAYSFGRAAKALASLFVDEAALGRVEPWADTYAHLLDPRFKALVEENLVQNRRWLEKQGAAVCEWLARRS